MKQIDNSVNIKPPKADTTSVGLPKGARTKGSNAGDRSGGTTSVAQADAISLTETAGSISRLQAYLSSLPEIDQARVNEIKSNLENGSYQIKPDLIVDALIEASK